MPDQNLWLDRVTHVSLVDEPEVGDSQFMVMKRDGDETPEGIEEALETLKAGRELSQSNIQTLADIHQQISGQHPAAAEKLEGFLREKASEDELEQILSDSTMTDKDIEELVEAVEKNNSAVEQAAEAATEAAEAAAEAAEAATAGSGEGQEGEGGSDPEGGQEAGGSEGGEGGSDALSDAAKERIQELEGLAVEAGLIEEDEVTEFGQEDGQEGDADLDEATEKRLNAIEKALDGQGEEGRAGSASILDGQGDGPAEGYVSKGRSGSTQVKDIMGAVQQEGE
jgi:prefoldin subunit 5